MPCAATTFPSLSYIFSLYPTFVFHYVPAVESDRSPIESLGPAFRAIGVIQLSKVGQEGTDINLNESHAPRLTRVERSTGLNNRPPSLNPPFPGPSYDPLEARPGPCPMNIILHNRHLLMLLPLQLQTLAIAVPVWNEATAGIKKIRAPAGSAELNSQRIILI